MLSLNYGITCVTIEVLMNQATIVLLGSFNPSIFHPYWFIAKGMFPEDSFVSKDDVVSSPSFTSFACPGDIVVEAQSNRLVFKTVQTHSFLRLGDFVAETMDLLPETPVRKIGLNLTLDVAGFSPQQWTKVGDAIFKKDIFGKILETSEDDEAFGLQTIKIRSPRRDERKGVEYLSVSVSPRTPEYEDPRILEVDSNSYYDLDQEEEPQLPSEMVRKNWEIADKRNREIMARFFLNSLGVKVNV